MDIEKVRRRERRRAAWQGVLAGLGLGARRTITPEHRLSEALERLHDRERDPDTP